ncbi:MAG: hypothetical protein IV100_12750 [Myxococcales bacterium]|nr:hypothetical protein [Myxococcales bacterium]
MTFTTPSRSDTRTVDVAPLGDRPRSVLAALLASAAVVLTAACTESTSGGTKVQGQDVQSAGGAEDAAADGQDGSDGSDGALDATDGQDATDAVDGDDGAIDGTEGEDGVDATDNADRIDFDPVTTNEKGLTPELSFTVPEDAISFHITAVTTGETGITIGLLQDPVGTYLVPKAWYNSPLNQGPSLCLGCRIRVVGAESAQGVLVPNTTEQSVKPGKYKLSFFTYTTTQGNVFEAPVTTPIEAQVTAHVLIRRSSNGPPAESILNLNLHFTGAGGLSADNAPDDPRIKKALQTFKDIYAQRGIAVGEVRYKDIDAGLKKIESISGPGNDFALVARLTEGNEEGINVIFVDSITESSNPFGGFVVILGVAGGIPGPAGVQGTAKSAVFVSLQDFSAQGGPSPDEGIGQVMAHECGHYLGLFHSSENSSGGQGIHDPLPDTEENDASNLMYFAGSGSNLSEGQGFVLRNNPWVVPK